MVLGNILLINIYIHLQIYLNLIMEILEDLYSQRKLQILGLLDNLFMDLLAMTDLLDHI